MLPCPVYDAYWKRTYIDWNIIWLHITFSYVVIARTSPTENLRAGEK